MYPWWEVEIMRKLCSAQFARLWKSKVFWTLEAICFLLGAVFYALVALNTKNIGQAWLLHNANSYFFIVLLYIGPVLAVFASLFLGAEYEHGTLRNKLTVGHSRRDIYLSGLAVTGAAGVIFFLTPAVTAVLIGVPLAGSAVLTALPPLAWRFPCVLLILAAYSALFTLLAMLDSNRARSAVISLLLALAMLLGGIAVYGRLAEPELTSRMVMQEDGSFQRQEGIPNSRYISGTARVLYKWADSILPSSSALHIVNWSGTFEGRTPACSAGLTLLLTGLGIALFKKKDIR